MAVIALRIWNTRTRFVLKIAQASDYSFELRVDLQASMTVGVFDQQAGCGDLIPDAPRCFWRTDFETTAGKDRVVR